MLCAFGRQDVILCIVYITEHDFTIMADESRNIPLSSRCSGVYRHLGDDIRRHDRRRPHVDAALWHEPAVVVIRPGRRVGLLRRLRLHVHHDVRHAAALRAGHQERVRVRPAQDDAHGAKSVTPTEIQQHRTAVTLYRNQTEERRTQCLVHGCCEIRLLYLCGSVVIMRSRQMFCYNFQLTNVSCA